MLYREIMAVCSEIHTKHINTLCGQNVELLNVKLAVHIVTTVRYIYWPLCCKRLNTDIKPHLPKPLVSLLLPHLLRNISYYCCSPTLCCNVHSYDKCSNSPTPLTNSTTKYQPPPNNPISSQPKLQLYTPPECRACCDAPNTPSRHSHTLTHSL